MSILIKGIDMPKSKDEALMLLILGDGTVAEKIGTNRYEEILDTQAKQIDRPHGRLIDGDKLRDEFSRTESGYCGGWEFCDKPEDFQFLIDDEPTILEAEE